MARTTGGAVAAVELKNVRKRFGETIVIDDLSLSVSPNEFVVFLGPSGCGKSTLLRMIAGLETVDGGEIRIDGERVDHLPPGDRGVAMVFQNYALYPHMSARQNLAFGLENARLPSDEIDARVRRAAEMLEISELLERKPTQLSGGQRQRVAIGRAIVKQPRLFLFDEPLSNLDAALRTRTRIELARLHQELASTMIFVTHDQIEAMTLAHRIVLLNERRIEQIGTPIDIYKRPATEFVASFVGTPKINILPVAIEDANGGTMQLRLSNGRRFAARLEDGWNAPAAALRLGVRAEDVSVTSAERGDIRGRVELVERLGDRTLVHTRLEEGGMLVAEDSGSSPVQSGEIVGLNLAGARIHLFDDRGRASHATLVGTAQANG
jgi:multiple sugar transport system ATP-binding protein